jgi:hypothetical protein
MSEMSEPEWTYENGVWTLCNDAIEVVVDEDTFDKHFQEYCLKHGIDTRRYGELMNHVTRVERQHYEVQRFLCHPEYWLGVPDGHIHITEKKQGEEQSMDEQNESFHFPLVTPVYTPVVRAGLRCVLFGLAQYVYHLAEDSQEKQRCFETLDRLVTRFQVGPVEEVRLDEHEISQILEAIGGFLLTLVHFQPLVEKDHVRLFITDWCGRLGTPFTPQQ